MDDLSEIYKSSRDSGPSAESPAENTLGKALYDSDGQGSEDPLNEEGDYYTKLAAQKREEEAAGGAEQAQREEAWADELREEYGTDFEDNIMSAQRLVEEMDEAGEVKSALNETRAGSHPALVKFLVKTARKMGY